MRLLRWLLPLLAVALFWACAPAAKAQEAPNLTPLCSLASTDAAKDASVLTDHSYQTYVTLKPDGFIQIDAPAGQPCEGLYLNLLGPAAPYAVQCLEPDGRWVPRANPDPTIVNIYVPLDHPAGSIRIVPDGDLRIAEICAFGPGGLPPWVQTWHRMEGKADLMLVVAHPDDEYVFLGGTLPYYCGQQQRKTIVVYMTTGYTRRRNELLDGLWTCGVRDYPELCEYRDGYTHLINYSFDRWGGRERVYRKVASLIRRYRPDVIVTQDLINGEDKHGMHRAAADATVNAVKQAADGSFDAASLRSLPPWQVFKLYLHLYPQNRIIMPWDQMPLTRFGGKTAADVAKEAFKKHVSQQKTRHKVYLCNPYDSKDFGLYFSTVGEDTGKCDFFEHVSENNF